MTKEQMLKTALGYRGISQAELARKLNTSPSNLNQKIKRNTITPEELHTISKILEAEFVCAFHFSDGLKVSLIGENKESL